MWLLRGKEVVPHKEVVYSAHTNEVEVMAKPLYLEEESSPQDHRFVWVYHVEITNHRKEAIQLIKRHWVISDATGLTQEVEGDGVVGEQPCIGAGDTFGYSSIACLSTPNGIMSGTYLVLSDGGELLEVEIPAFSLDADFSKPLLN